jgi:hypothetical protein
LGLVGQSRTACVLSQLKNKHPKQSKYGSGYDNAWQTGHANSNFSTSFSDIKAEGDRDQNGENQSDNATSSAPGVF